LREHDIVRTA